MNKINMFDALNLIDDELIEEAIKTDSAKNLKETDMEKVIKIPKAQNKMRKIISAIAACICLLLIGAVTLNGQLKGSDAKLIQISNPLTDVQSASEMKNYLGFDVPVIKSKKVAAYTVIGDGKYADHARITYTDKSEFNMEKGSGKDVSGIYGAKLDEAISVNGVKTNIYSFDGSYYASWSDSDYSYSYYASSKQAVNDGVKEIISANVNL